MAKPELRTRRTPGPTWMPKSAKSRHKCGACGRTLLAQKFPTTAKQGVRMGECRQCRDTRLGWRA